MAYSRQNKINSRQNTPNSRQNNVYKTKRNLLTAKQRKRVGQRLFAFEMVSRVTVTHCSLGHRLATLPQVDCENTKASDSRDDESQGRSRESTSRRSRRIKGRGWGKKKRTVFEDALVLSGKYLGQVVTEGAKSWIRGKFEFSS